MNTIYLLLDEKKDFACVKIGFTAKLENRLYAYEGYTPFTQCISIQHTQKRSKRLIETLYHKELEKKGYAFVGKQKREWVVVQYDDPLYTAIKEKGLGAFKSSQGRKVYMMVE